MLKVKLRDTFLALHASYLNLLLTQIASRAYKRIGVHLRFNNSRATSSLFRPQLEVTK